MKTYIVITTINSPCIAVNAYALMQDKELVIVGDQKTPEDYFCYDARFISYKEQMGFEIEKILPFNHYSRKMIGYLYAMKNGADVIIDTDDDNIPLSNYRFPDFCGKYHFIKQNKGFINIYKYYTSHKIWPRGLPLDAINNAPKIQKEQNFNKIGIWQGLADGDPDVDAIYRLTNNKRCIFNKKEPPLVLEKGTICPINTQNTATIRDLFCLLYLPATVTFRFTDILKGYVAQPIMWQNDYLTGFLTACVVQKRNVHDYTQDFLSEIPCYTLSKKVVELVTDAVRENCSIYDNLYNSYVSLYNNQIVKREELSVLSAWLKDCQRYL